MGLKPSQGGSQSQKLFEHAPAIRMGFVKQFRVELHTKKWAVLVLHRLDRTRLICGGGRTGGRLLTSSKCECQTVIWRASLEDPWALSGRHRNRARVWRLIPLARFQPSHKPDRSSEGQSHLLVTATYSEDWLWRVPITEKLRQRFGEYRPRDDLAAEDDVRRIQCLNSLERNLGKRSGRSSK